MTIRDVETQEMLSAPLKGKRVLFISYNGMLDPLGQSQVLPYLRELADRGVLFTLLSFERAAAFTPEGSPNREILRAELARKNIEWHVLRYHQTPSVPATVYDVVAGIRCARQLIRSNRIELVHARSYIPVAIAIALKRMSKVNMIFDIRGLMAEEYVEAGHWRAGSIAYRLTKSVERRALKNADGVVTLTQKIWPVISDWEGLRGREVVHEVVPCCADLNLFDLNLADRKQRRDELGLGQRVTLVYSGSIGSWYLAEEMIDFFVQLLAKRSDAYFLWLTPGDPNLIHQAMSARGIGLQSYMVKKIVPSDMPSYLSAADAGIAFYKPGLSKLATSPVKITEYLACGLPVVVNSGIGDSDSILGGSGVGTVVARFEDVEYEKAVRDLEAMLANVDQTRRAARELARKLFDLHDVGGHRYERLYRRVFAGR